jgi:hypothetical protein
MRTKPGFFALHVVVLVAVAVLAGCAAPGKLEPAACSGPDHCEITVTVDEACNVNVQDKVDVAGPNRAIRWRLAASPAFRFASNGIEFRHPGTMFHTPTPGNTTFIWHDRNPPSQGQANGGQGTEYEYEVHVLRGDVACPVHDPWIVNRG